MPICSDDLCAFADQVSQSKDSDETALRAAASRAYYAAFHALLPTVSTLPPSAKFRPGAMNITHEDFATRLSELARAKQFDPQFASIRPLAGQLVRLVDACRTTRVKADYKLTTEFRANESIQQVHRARQILRAIKGAESSVSSVGAIGRL